MKSLLFLFLSLACFATSIHSQIFVSKDGTIYDQRQQNTSNSGTNTMTRYKNPSNSGFDISKLSLGGNFGLQFGDYTIINISPQLGYDISTKFTLGTGMGYTYFKQNKRAYDYKNSYLSFDIFARYYPVNGLVLSVQPEISRMWASIEDYGQKYSETKFIPSFLVGVGFRLQNAIALIQYDVVQDSYSPYGNSIFYTIGYCFNF